MTICSCVIELADGVGAASATTASDATHTRHTTDQPIPVGMRAAALHRAAGSSDGEESDPTIEKAHRLVVIVQPS